MLLYAVASPAQATAIASRMVLRERSIVRCLMPLALQLQGDPGLSPGISCGRSYRALRDGSFEDAFPGTLCQATIGVSLRDGLVDALQRHLTRERASNFVNTLRRGKTSQIAVIFASFNPGNPPNNEFALKAREADLIKLAPNVEISRAYTPYPAATRGIMG